MRRIIPGLLALFWAGAGWAANSLHFGPPPQWVKAIPLPAAGATTRAAVKILLFDQQMKLTSRTVSHYAESVIRIQTPEGLSPIGTITLVWDPDTDVLTVHKIHILRGDKIIDVLGSGQAFTVARRETNLDSATLDDTLTAILQPADLQVGDTVDLAYTVERTDPVLAGASADEAEVSPLAPISELHVSALWPSTDPVKWQSSDAVGGIQRTHEGGMSGITLSMSDVQPILEPKQAPLRFLVDRRIDVSEVSSWQDLAKLFAPLYQHAARLSPSSPLLGEIARIRAAAADPKARAALALALVEDKVRYVLLAMNNGGLVPADADQTWSRRYGDCKGKSVLLLALLHGLGIEARPVLVNTRAADGLDERLPMSQLFDHVLVEATIDGQTYWLDGTRLGDTSLDHLHVPYYHWGLPLVPEGTELVKMVPVPLASPITETTISVDASAGVAVPVPFHVDAALHDDDAIMMQQRLANLTPQQLDAGLRSLWSRQYDFVKIKSVAATYDEKNEVERLTMDGMAKLDWIGGQYAPVGLGIGYDANFERQPGPHQDAPFAVPYPIYDSNTITIKLPRDGQGFSVSGADVDKTVGGIEYQRHAKIAGGVFTAMASTRSVAPEFPAAEAAADQQVLRDLSKANLDIDAPADHAATARIEQKLQDVSKAALGMDVPGGHAPTTVVGTAKGIGRTEGSYTNSGYELFKHGEYDAAIADYDVALALDPNDTLTLGNRGFSYFWKGDTDLARADFDAALAIDPHAWVALNGRGLLALYAGDEVGAIAAFTAAIDFYPEDDYALSMRAQTYWLAGKRDQALADYSEVIRQQPSATLLYWYRSVLLSQEGKKPEALNQAELMTAADPASPGAYLMAGAIYRSFGESAKASAAFDQAVAVAPVARTYVMRADYRFWTDLPGKRADVEKALQLDPKSSATLEGLAQVQMAEGQYSQAVASLTEALANSHHGTDVLIWRAVAYQKAGQTALGQADLANALAQANGPRDLNSLCWRLATADVSLAAALDYCNAALAKDPALAQALDSRGFVLMRLGRYDEAIASYDSALKLDSLEADSLYGRGICELRSGKEDRGHTDIEAATALSFSVADEFAHYGVQP